MSVLGAILLLFGGLVGLLGAWNAARPVRHPTRRYSPFWLPAMVFTELAPFWLLCNLAGLAAGLLLGGWDNPAGRAGAFLVMLTTVLLLYLMARSALAVRRLRPLVDGVIHPARGRARLVGRPVPTPPGVDEQHRIPWRPGLTLDLVRPASPAAGAAPVLVYVHGGGWTGGDPQHQARDLYHTLALDGWVIVAIRYPFTPSVTVEEQIETVHAAVRWARRELADHGVVAQQVVLGGGSAGGHLAAMAALTAGHPDERVDACVGIYGVYDMANRTPTRATWTKIRDEVMLQTVDEAPERYRVAVADRPHHRPVAADARGARHGRHAGAGGRGRAARAGPPCRRSPGRLRAGARRAARVRRAVVAHVAHVGRGDPRLDAADGAGVATPRRRGSRRRRGRSRRSWRGTSRDSSAHARLGDRLDESLTSQPSGARPSQVSSNSANPGIDLAAIVRTGPAATRLQRICLAPSSRAR